MLSPEEITEQQQLLATHRQTLAIYQTQRALIGNAYSPPALISGIEEARSNIKRIKAILRAAGVVVPDDPDDESTTSTFTRPAALLAPGRPRRIWVWLVLVDVIVLILAIGGWWLFIGRPADTSSQQATSPAFIETTPPNAAPSEETPAAELTTAELEGQLQKANISLSETQIEIVRGFINDPGTPYKLLAEHALQVVGDQKFRDTLYLDELDTRYTDLVGADHYADFDEERLKEAMVRAWNEHYTDKQVSSFDEIVEARP
jgi:hypothetical protein